jgi:WD40 repeat protein/serine/threonine protein kinase
MPKDKETDPREPAGPPSDATVTESGAAALTKDRCPNGHPVPEGTDLCPTCGTFVAGGMPVVPASATLPLVPGYELLEELGRGGMGVVYKARHVRLDRIVALKMILAGEFASADTRQRFQREAEAVARLQHPHVVLVYEIGEAAGKAFLSLEFVDGPSLAERLRGTPLAPRQAAQLVLTLAKATQFAHEQGIVHRDLKPANILIAGAGDLPAQAWIPKIADFGLAKRLHEATQHTQPGAVLGTPSYMAPEQASAERGQITPLTDVYSLGAILYETLTGRPPFRGNSVHDVLEQVATREPISPAALQPKTPDDLVTICLKCLEKNANQRYASAAALAEDLERYLSGRPIVARPVGWLRRSWKGVKRRPALTLFLSALALSLLGGTIVSTWFAWEARTARRLADGRLYIANVRLTQRAWEESQLDWQAELLDSVAPGTTGGVDFRGFEWYFWKRINKPFVQLPVDDLAAGMAFRPDSKAMAYVQDKKVKLWNFAADSNERAWPALTEKVERVAWSPDGRLVAVKVGAAIRVYDLEGGKPFALNRQGQSGQVRCLAFSADSRWLASGGPEGEVRLWAMPQAGSSFVLGEFRGDGIETEPRGDVDHVAFGPKEPLLVSISSDGILELWDLVKQTVVFRFPNANQQEKQAAAVHSTAFSPRKALLAAGLADGRVIIWDISKYNVPLAKAATGWPLGNWTGRNFNVPVAKAATGWPQGDWTPRNFNVIHSFRAHAENVRCLAFSPDGRRLASACGENLGNEPVRIWNVDVGTIHEEPKRHFDTAAEWTYFRGPHSGGKQLQFSADGEMLACSAGGTLWVWKIDEHSCVRELSDTSQPVLAVACSADGTRIATTAGNQIQILDRRTLKTALLGGHSKKVTCVAFHPHRPVLASGAEDRTVKVWDLAIGKELGTLVGHEGPVRGLAFHPAGQRLIAVGDGSTARVWELDRQVPAFTLPNISARSAVFSRDGKLLVIGRDDGVISIHEADTGVENGQLASGKMPVTALAFQGSGSKLASGAEDHLFLWDFERREKKCEIRGHSKQINALSFSTDGRRLASVTDDGVLRVHDMDVEEEVFVWRQAGPVSSVAFSADGETLIAGYYRRTKMGFPAGGAMMWWAPRSLRGK